MNAACNPTRWSKVLVLVALLHYLNACPCGCLEHHALYQAVVGDGHHHHDHDTDEPADSEADAYHCDGPSDIVFAAGRGDAGANASSASLMAASIAPPPAAPSLQASSLKARATANSALGVCAELQVMLI